MKIAGITIVSLLLGTVFLVMAAKQTSERDRKASSKKEADESARKAECERKCENRCVADETAKMTPLAAPSSSKDLISPQDEARSLEKMMLKQNVAACTRKCGVTCLQPL